MAEQDVSSIQPPDEMKPVDLDDPLKQRQEALGNIVETLKPWLFEFGNWIFGGLLAFNLVIVAPLLTLPQGHPEILIAITAFVCALPLDVSGLFLMKLIKDIRNIAIDDVMKEAFKDIRSAAMEAAPWAAESGPSLYKKRTDISLRYSVRLAALSTVFTMLGMTAALWYIAWWVAVTFLVMIAISFLMTITMIGRLMRPLSDDEKAFALRYREQRSTQHRPK